MADEPTTVVQEAEPKVEETATETPPETPTPAPEPAVHRGYVPDGSGDSYSITTEQLRQWAEHGMLRARQDASAVEPAAEPEPEPKVEQESVGDSDDPVAAELRAIRAEQVKQREVQEAMQQERETEKEQGRQRQQASDNRKALDRMLGKHAAWAKGEKDALETIEAKAGIMRQRAMSEGEVMTVDEAIAKSAAYFGEKMGMANREAAQQKQDVRAGAAEAPGGSAAVATLVAPSRRTKAEMRQDSVEMCDGTADREAYEIWQEYRNAPAG